MTLDGVYESMQAALEDARGDRRIMRADLAEARACVREGLELAKFSGTLDHKAWVYWREWAERLVGDPGPPSIRALVEGRNE